MIHTIVGYEKFLHKFQHLFTCDILEYEHSLRVREFGSAQTMLKKIPEKDQKSPHVGEDMGFAYEVLKMGGESNFSGKLKLPSTVPLALIGHFEYVEEGEKLYYKSSITNHVDVMEYAISDLSDITADKLCLKP